MRSFAVEETTGLRGNLRSTFKILKNTSKRTLNILFFFSSIFYSEWYYQIGTGQIEIANLEFSHPNSQILFTIFSKKY